MERIHFHSCAHSAINGRTILSGRLTHWNRRAARFAVQLSEAFLTKKPPTNPQKNESLESSRLLWPA